LAVGALGPLYAQEPAPPRPVVQQPGGESPAELAGRPVEQVRVLGNRQIASAVILNVVRTREGEPFDPATVNEDYQRIYGLRRFSNVEARVEPTERGVVVVFIVTEQAQITEIAVRGNLAIDTLTLRQAANISVGDAIDRFRVSQARQAIERLYRSRNFPFAHVEVPPEPLAAEGRLIFNVVEGPNVRIRNIAFRGARSFGDDRLKRQIRSRTWIWIFRPGTLDPDLVDDDVASLRRFYEGKGFFDVRVGRRMVFSPDMTEAQIEFVIEEGPRYQIDRITFQGNDTIAEAELRQRIRTQVGQPYDDELIQRDIRNIVRAYSPFGFIYQPGAADPDYLQVDVRRIFRREAGLVDLVYAIDEGRPFRVGQIRVRGNSRTQDKVVLREMRVHPGMLYNSGELQDAAERLRALPYFSRVTITPIGDDPEERDVLVEVVEARTATFTIGAGINSNGGVGGNVTYEQRNFDITNWPATPGDLFTDRAFVGAGQNFRISLEPGTQATNASIRFREPYLFDQPYGFTGELYLRDRRREDYNDRRLGGRVSVDHRFDQTWSGSITLRGEQVRIGRIQDREIRAFEILEEEGKNWLTSARVGVTRDTTNRGLLPWRGMSTTAAWEPFGVMGGEYDFHKFTLAHAMYFTLHEDLLERRTILSISGDVGYLTGGAPFFERFYGGGIGSVRGFAFRGISPRSGPDDDRIGGDFIINATAEVSFPVAGENVRAVVFTDVGTVEEDFRLGTIRSSVGAGLRIVLPVLGQVPIALDFAVPVTKDDQDDTQFISFSLGILP
jgi:outer membrane protein insertion porin family